MSSETKKFVCSSSTFSQGHPLYEIEEGNSTLTYKSFINSPFVGLIHSFFPRFWFILSLTKNNSVQTKYLTDVYYMERGMNVFLLEWNTQMILHSQLFNIKGWVWLQKLLFFISSVGSRNKIWSGFVSSLSLLFALIVE